MFKKFLISNADEVIGELLNDGVGLTWLNTLGVDCNQDSLLGLDANASSGTLKSMNRNLSDAILSNEKDNN